MSSVQRALLVVSALALAPVGSASAGEKPANTTRILMGQKLEAAHGLLESIVREDFPMIARHAETLANLGKATTWHRAGDEDFMQYAGAFRRSAEFLLEQARAKNLEGAALGYVRVTLDCMQCHKFVRGKQAQ